jgi:hypothetical protein
MTTPPDVGHGSIWTRKLGPLPYWAWAGLGLGAALTYTTWRRNKSDSAAPAAPNNTTSVPDQTPPQVIRQDTYITDINTPPAGGRHLPPPGVSTNPPPGGGITPVPTPGPPLNKTPVPTPTPTPAPAGQWVTVAKFTSKNPPWNSTLSGIAAKLLGNANNWTKIWNDPQNASLKSRRGAPEKIQPNDRIWVPAK